MKFICRYKTKLSMILCVLFIPCSAFASEMGMNPWETILNKLAQSLTGPVAYAIAIIAIVLSGITMAFADLQGGAKRFIQAACGLSVAFFAMQIVTNFLGFSGAVL
ncbi:MAG: TrbC/VirB2 family protein [Candidatus Marinimicrobia bacterium]|nr:TrbC/VirB2 family protein [Candidatus Neomarinimicrobiota bacterium]